ncbi:hypothetical protein V5O48_014520 [Marasmius crinis-equi]|uniref:Uncharacterized protein n=1 Tax=Marasmius crinis-equi TaxID=585013 RepID=A0ABR3EXD7_9AGAR
MPLVGIKKSHLTAAGTRSELGQQRSMLYKGNPPSVAELKKQIKAKKPTNPPLTTLDCQKKSMSCRTRAAEIKDQIVAIRRFIRGECNRMSDDFNMEPRYFADMVYQGGARISKPLNEPNTFNAYKAVVSYERREAGEKPLPLIQLQELITDDYHTLSNDALEKIMAKYKDIRDEERLEKVKRPSMKEKIADVKRTVDHAVGLFNGLKTR